MRYIALKAFFGLSIVFSTVLLLTDVALWTVAPDHAYALIILTLADCILLGAAFRYSRAILRYAKYWGIFKTILLLGDVFTAPQYGLTYIEFATYLFSLWQFVGLFLSQIGITISAILYTRFLKIL